MGQSLRLRIWLAINYLGAVCVCVNTAYRGQILEHVLRNSPFRAEGWRAPNPWPVAKVRE